MRAHGAPSVPVVHIVAAMLALVAGTAGRTHAAPHPICTAAEDQLYPIAVADGSGGAIVVWNDNRAGGSSWDVYAHRVRPDGSADPSWPAGGVAVCTATNVQYSPFIASDGAGGAIIAWYDLRGGSWRVYAQRVRASGAVDPAWPVDGLAVCGQVSAQMYPDLVADGSGGAIVAWLDTRNDAYGDIYAQRVLGSGALDPAWPAGGVALCSVAKEQSKPRLAADGAGGAVVVWTDKRGTAEDIYAQRVLASGVVDPAWPANGAAVCAATGKQLYPRLVADGAGGALVTWQDSRAGTYSQDIYAQRITSAGVASPGWTTDGVRLATSGSYPRLVSDGAGGAIVAWEGSDVFAQRVLATGAIDPAWPAGGLPVCVASWDQLETTLAPDGSGGAMLAWQDNRAGSSSQADLYAQHVLAAGSADPAWTTNGEMVCDATFKQTYPNIVPGDPGKAVVVWQDNRDGLYDIYAAAIEGPSVEAPLPPPVGALHLAPVRPQPVRGAATLRFGLTGEGPVVLEVRDLGGRRVRTLLREVRGAGAHAVRWALDDEAGRAAAPGVYHAVLVAEGARRSVRLIVLR